VSGIVVVVFFVVSGVPVVVPITLAILGVDRIEFVANIQTRVVSFDGVISRVSSSVTNVADEEKVTFTFTLDTDFASNLQGGLNTDLAASKDSRGEHLDLSFPSFGVGITGAFVGCFLAKATSPASIGTLLAAISFSSYIVGSSSSSLPVGRHGRGAVIVVVVVVVALMSGDVILVSAVVVFSMSEGRGRCLVTAPLTVVKFPSSSPS